MANLRRGGWLDWEEERGKNPKEAARDIFQFRVLGHEYIVVLVCWGKIVISVIASKGCLLARVI